MRRLQRERRHDLATELASDCVEEGGDGGGTIVAEGSPEEVAKNEKSYTGQFLKKILGGKNK